MALQTLCASGLLGGRIADERILIITDKPTSQLVSLIMQLVDHSQITIVTSPNTPLLQPHHGWRVIRMDLTASLAGLQPQCEPFKLIICTDPVDLLTAERLPATLQNWIPCLDLSAGRILVELQRQDGGWTSPEHFLAVEGRYRLAMSAAPFEIIEINSIPRDNNAVTSVPDIRSAAYRQQSFARLVKEKGYRQVGRQMIRDAQAYLTQADELLRALSDSFQTQERAYYDPVIHFLNQMLLGNLSALMIFHQCEHMDDSSKAYFARLVAQDAKGEEEA